MKACWLTDPLSRPTFTDIKERFEMLISKGTPYVEFDFDTENPYYNVPSFMSVGESEGASSEEDRDEDETGWERRFQSLDRSTAVSIGDRYAGDADRSKWLSTDFTGESAGYVSQGRGPLESTGSDMSTTPLADEVFHCTASTNNPAESSLTRESRRAQKLYQWSDDKARSSRTCGLPSTEELNEAPFTIDQYVNFDP